MADAHATLARHGRTFHWAGKFLRTEAYNEAVRLYQFCRHLDDLTDLPGEPAQITERLGEARHAIATGSSADPDLCDFLELTAPYPIARRAALLLLDTFLRDLGLVRIADEAELLTYCLGVAGTVGIMMASILRTDQPSLALPHAIDLGIAMQLTNIARDVEEDTERDRVYVPATWLVSGDAWSARLRLLDLAELYYASGGAGLRYLPSQARLGIRVAARCYRSIGHALRKRGPLQRQRVVVSSTRKGIETVKALLLPDRPAAHDPSLHALIQPTLNTYELTL